MLAHPLLSDRDKTVVMQATSFLQLSSHISGYANAKNKADLRLYFEYSSQGIEVVEDGLKEVSFGEYLVDQGVLDRYQLFRALQMQDRLPGVRLGEAAAALGYAPIGAIERLFVRFQQLATVDVE
ncbi:MAG: hypothetical protein KF773_42715 [Deltaproteobacteria bacterium]|nr:hypothetical protein [Deltaproteobacteria bacterium]MCW5802745.1 hypothetical protein [Deltaproteobacteria bacterium]